MSGTKSGPEDSGSSHGWCEYTSSDGRRYYHNSKSGQSTWDKPEELKSPEERANFTPWKDYTTADGRTYYFNTETKQSVWTMPRELRKLRGLPTESDEEEVVYGSKEEARSAFKQLLEEKGITYRWKWDESAKVIQGDKRFKALETSGEKRQVFAEYIGQNKKKHIELEREKKKNARGDLHNTLKAWKDLKPITKYKDFAEAMKNADWWKWLDEKERDDLFQDYMDDFVRQSKHDKRKDRRDKMDKLQKHWEDSSEFHADLKWREVKEAMAEVDIFTQLDKLDALQAWQDFVRRSDNQEEQERLKKQRTEGRKARDGWSKFLESKIQDGKFTASSTWKQFVEDYQVEESPQYLGLVDVEGSTAREIFEDYLAGLLEALTDEKNVVKKLLRNSNAVITPETTFQQFLELLSGSAEFEKMISANKEAIYDSLAKGDKEEEKKVEMKRSRKKDDSDSESSSDRRRSSSVTSHKKKEEE
eukprot:Platyproteum_vivax@DN6866_c0_g1_i1.p1